MTNNPTCFTCEHWSFLHPCEGWCNFYNRITSAGEICEKYSFVKLETQP